MRFGLREAVEEKQRRLREAETHGDYHSTYSSTFRWAGPPASQPARAAPHSLSLPLPGSRPPAADGEGTQGPRYATPRHLSSHLHPHRGNGHLALRGLSQLMAPEIVDDRLLRLKPAQLRATQ